MEGYHEAAGQAILSFMKCVGIDLSGPSNIKDTCVTVFSGSPSGKMRLEWLQTQGLEEITGIAEPSDHYVAACAAALGAWKWALGESKWLYPADPPLHPFDYAS